MNILEEIVAHKAKEVAEAKSRVAVGTLEKAEFFHKPINSLTGALTAEGASGIIAEIKRRSPSKGLLNPSVSIESTSRGYVAAGASALSILTDQKYFGGSSEDLMVARRLNQCPILRKDFMIDEYQVIEARSMGADVVLLIAAVLTPVAAKSLARFAHSLGLEVLLEVHNREELEKMSDAEADLIGVNNRNLKTFEVNVDTSRRIAALIPDSVVKISESGISDVATIRDLREYGFQGFLMGERFMKATNPGEAAGVFIDGLRKSGKAKA